MRVEDSLERIKNNRTPLIIGITGGSGSGKTTLAHNLLNHFGKEICSLLAQDSYYIDQSHLFDEDGGSVNFDHPDSLDFKLLAEHLSKLKRFLPIEVPLYDFPTHTRSKKTLQFNPVPLILLDGTLILTQPNIQTHLDFSVFVKTSETVRFERRLFRDTQERGREASGVKKQFSLQVKPMHDRFVEPSQDNANLVCSGEASLEMISHEVISKIKNFLLQNK